MSLYCSRLKSLTLFISSLALMLIAGCAGDEGPAGPQGPAGASVASAATSITITIDNVTVNSAPVVEFTAVNENGVGVTGLTTSNVRFNISKLVPGTNGGSSYWQNYINRSASSDIQGTTESNGTLADLGNGQYTYTFDTDITNVTSPLAVSYDASLTHRVAIQVSGYPATNPIYDFVPGGGTVSLRREIVKTETCNQCHNKLAMHGGGRIETQYCVTCHNPGSTDPDTGNTVDFKVMVHKIHRGEDLPSVVKGPDLLASTADDGTGTYQIIGFRSSVHDYSTVVFPQDIRNCSVCHDGSDPDTPQGDNWKTQLSMEACGSCHDDIDFSKDGSATGAADPIGHPGGIQSDNSQCATCHQSSGLAKSVVEAHELKEVAARATFQYNILEICGTAVGSNPVCAPGVTPTVKISVTDPTNSDAAYDIDGATGDPEFTSGSASLNVLIAFDTDDYHNNSGAGTRPARAESINAKSSPTDNGDGTFTVTASAAIPAAATGSGAVAIEGHPAAALDGDAVYNDRVAVKGVVAYFGITDTTPTARRTVVDNAKCNNCHQQVNFHGSNRNGEVALCVMCHNPRNTDVGRRPKDVAGAVDVAATVDGKKEQSVDFRVMIHGIHAGAETNYDNSEGHGIREKGLVAYGFGGSAHDYGHVRFPGILNDCETCHTSGTYELDGDWESPMQNGLLASTMTAAFTATDTASLTTELADQTDDLNTTPTAAVCSSCHDSNLAKAHMQVPGGAVFDSTQATLDAAAIETCAVCHGPGRDADVAKVHAED